MTARQSSSLRAISNRSAKRHNLGVRFATPTQRARKTQRAKYLSSTGARRGAAARRYPKATRTLSMAAQGTRTVTGRNLAGRSSIHRAKYVQSGGKTKVARRAVGGAFNRLHPRASNGRFKRK